MLARRLTAILPDMTLAEALETTRIHSVAGRTGARTAVITTRPCRALTSYETPCATDHRVDGVDPPPDIPRRAS